MLNDKIWAREIFLYVKFLLHDHEEHCLGSIEYTKKPDRVMAACYPSHYNNYMGVTGESWLPKLAKAVDFWSVNNPVSIYHT